MTRRWLENIFQKGKQRFFFHDLRVYGNSVHKSNAAETRGLLVILCGLYAFVWRYWPLERRDHLLWRTLVQGPEIAMINGLCIPLSYIISLGLLGPFLLCLGPACHVRAFCKTEQGSFLNFCFSVSCHTSNNRVADISWRHDWNSVLQFLLIILSTKSKTIARVAECYWVNNRKLRKRGKI